MEKSWLAVLCLLLIATAGCADKSSSNADAVIDPQPTAIAPPAGPVGAVGPKSSEPQEPEDPAEPEKPTSPEGPANRAPTAKLGASVTSGVAPLDVDLTIGGSDPDHDEIDWHLDLDGDGTMDLEGSEVPDWVSHQFTEPGLYEITLSISDGELNGTASIQIEVMAARPPAPLYELTGVVQDACTTPCNWICEPGGLCVATLGAFGCSSFATQEQGGDCIWFAIPRDAIGHDFKLTSSAGNPNMQFTESCSVKDNDPERRLGSAADGTGYFSDIGGETGQVPHGYGCAVIWERNEGPSLISFVIM